MSHAPPKDNAADLAGAALADSTGQRRHGSKDNTDQAYVVFCLKGDGRRAFFNRYATRQEADAVAQTLVDVGCRAVAEPTS